MELAKHFEIAAHAGPHGVLERLLGSHQLAKHFGILLLLADLALLELFSVFNLSGSDYRDLRGV